MQTTSSPVRLLYLEDEVLIALDTEYTLRDLGIDELHIAHKLQNAQSLASEIDLTHALLDINVGNGQNSLAFGRELAGRGVKVIFASGYNPDQLDMDLDGFRYLEKPLRAETLRDCLLEEMRPLTQPS